MTTHVRVGGSWREVNDIHVRVSGSWRRCAAVYARVAGNWELVHSTLSVSISPSSAVGSGSAQMQPVFTNSVTATATGGEGGYSYSWQRISGSSLIQATQQNSPTTPFFVEPGTSNGVYSAVFQCTVTSAGVTATATVSVQITVA